MSAKKKLKLEGNKDLERITEVEFERGIINVLRELRTQTNSAVNMLNDIDYYKSKGHKIRYYFNHKGNTYNYVAYKEDIGFKYEVKK